MYAVLCDAGVGADENLHLQVPEFVAPAPDQITLYAYALNSAQTWLEGWNFPEAAYVASLGHLQ